MAVRGLANTGPQSIAVNISTSDGPSEAEKEADRLRKEKIAQQNALPAWMSNSTITGESYSATADANASGASKEPAGRNLSQNKLVDNSATTQIDDIFEKLKAEQAAILAREEDEEEEEEYASEEEDDEFEDVLATGNNSGLGTPGIKAEASEVPSGDISRNGDSTDERAIKRVKVEPETKKDSSGIDEDDDEDEIEFEDI
jgi:transcription initiation factor TFIIE subunit alpha